MSLRIGLYGGSFDPVHNGHVALACCALATLGLDELRWVPAGRPWQKDELTPAVHRVAMLRLATAGEARQAIETCEIEGSGPNYTVDTVAALQAREPGAEWWLLIGQDQHANLHTWSRWAELLGRVRLAVAARPGTPPAVDPAVARAGWTDLPMPPSAVSASEVRGRVARGQTIGGLVPAAVARYIESRGLYRALPPQHRS